MRRSARSTLAALLGAGLIAPVLVLGPAGAQDAAGPHDTDGAVLNIVPPGSDGVTTADDALLGQIGQRPENETDQLEMYDAINAREPAGITEDSLLEFYKDAPIELPEDEAVSTETPRPGVVIRRDSFGVPFVEGETVEDVAYGAGYAGTQDRMFLQDALRHVGAARVTEFLGPSDANIAMDAEQLRAADYTPEEAEAQIEAAVGRYGEEAAALARRLDAFLEGINDAQDAMCPAGPTGPECPVEYAALQIVPDDWTRADVVYIASLVGGIFGKGGGGEADNARWLQQLTAEFGDEEGRRIFDDLRLRDDPEAPTTIDVRFPYGGERGTEGVVLPDVDGPTAPGAGARLNGGAPEPVAPLGVVDGPFGPIDLGLRRDGGPGMSNALLVGAQATDTGRPLAVFGPQTGYFAPQLLTEVSLSGPGIAARGVSFSGTQLVVQLGHGVDYAWSATSASGDNVDTVVSPLCEPDGSEPTVESEHYLDDSSGTEQCVPLEQRVHRQVAKPSPGGSDPDVIVDLLVLRTRHGIVQLRTTADDEPVAISLERSTYTKELDSAVGFARVNDPGYVRDAATFADAFSAVDYTFHWFYLDDRDISYFESGLLPLRSPDVDYDLPRSGQARFDWRGDLTAAAHPQQTNPPSGFLSSWNNKPAPGFSAADNAWGYGPVYRSLSLDDRIVPAIAGSATVGRAELVGLVQDAATVDVRGAQLLPELLAVVGDDSAVAAETAALRAWLDDGANRVDRDRDGSYRHEGAIALMDAWWEGGFEDAAAGDGDGSSTGESVAKEVLRATLGDLVDELPKALDDHPRQGLGSAWNGIAWYGYVDKDLRAVLGESVSGPVGAASHEGAYCGQGSLEQCRDELRASLADASARVAAAQGTDDVSSWTYDKSEDAIVHTPLGVQGVDDIDWQNRPTFQQVVDFRSSRRDEPGAPPPPPPGTEPPPQPGGGTEPPPPAQAAPAPSRARGGDPQELARTGGSPALPLAALVVAGTLLGLRRSRRSA
jgi:acyl-homoserine lactone acylase PvdQ